MQNFFSASLSFNDMPLSPYEWKEKIYISGLKVKKVTHKCLIDLLLYDSKIMTSDRIVLVSDGNTSVVLRLNNDGVITARSFLDYEMDLRVLEYSKQLKPINLKYEKIGKKINYTSELNEDITKKNYLLSCLNKCKNKDLLKYLYYICFDNLNGYSKEKLVNYIKKEKFEKTSEIYDILLSA